LREVDLLFMLWLCFAPYVNAGAPDSAGQDRCCFGLICSLLETSVDI